MRTICHFILAVLFLTLPSSCEIVVPNARISYQDRTYHSETIDTLIEQLKDLFIDKNVAILFENTLPNTLDTTVLYYNHDISNGDIDSFVITGDIEALWLRDSTNQVLPYIPYTTEDVNLQYLIEGLIQRQAKSIIIDPFANSFNFNSSNEGHQKDITTPPMKRSVFEGKYEIDSLMAFLKLSYWQYFYDNDSISRFATDKWFLAISNLLDTIETMQYETGTYKDSPYLFERYTTEGLDTLIMQGRGTPSKPCGLSRSLFRPSDDAVLLPYNIPGNAMACVELNHLIIMLTAIKEQKADVSKLLEQSMKIKNSLCASLESVIETSIAGVIPYEVDGYGGKYYMDDANIPSLLSLPLIGYNCDNYKATRNYALSKQNPFYFYDNNGNAVGPGSPHTGMNQTWPMALIVQAITSDNDDEIRHLLNQIIASNADTGFLHESFDTNDVTVYTRSWFAWCNTLYGEFILNLLFTKPHLLLKDNSVPIDKLIPSIKRPVSYYSMKEKW